MKAVLTFALSCVLISPSSNGGEYHRYAVTLGVPEEMLEHFQLAFGDETFGLMHDPDFGMVLEDPAQEGVPFKKKRCQAYSASLIPQFVDYQCDH